MKLISLYIENFGGLSQYALDFQDGLTAIEESNGFGKTTLAEFIRAMFYGFPRKAKTLDKSRRQKYTPWNGGRFGGNLVFETEGCQYRVERTFGATPKGDSFTLIDLATNKKSSRYTEELGLELFQLDADSFERSTYLPQVAEGMALTTDSIRSKLSNLVEDTNDVGNYEKAIAALKTKRSTFVPYRGNGGSVMQANTQVSLLQQQLIQTESKKEMLEQAESAVMRLTQQRSDLEKQQAQIRQEIRQASESAAAAAVHQHRNHLAEQLEAGNTICRKLQAKYPAGIPDDAQIKTARHAADQLAILNGRIVTEQEDLDAAAYVEANRSRFADHLPTPEELHTCRDWCQQHAQLQSGTVTLEAAVNQQPERKTNPVSMILCAVLGIAGIAAGFALGWHQLWGGIALGIGAAALIGAVVLAIRFGNAQKQLRLMLQEQLAQQKKLEQLKAEAAKLAEKIGAFLKAYGPMEGTDFYNRLSELERSSGAYYRAQKRAEQWHQEKTAHEAEVSRWQVQLQAFFEQYTLTAQRNVPDQLLQIRDDRKDWEETQEACRRLTDELERYTADNKELLSRPILENADDPEALRQQEMKLNFLLTGCSEELLRMQQRCDLLREQVRRIPEIRDELQMWQEKKLADQKKADLLDDTMALLEQAKENLATSFMGPIRSSFAQYLDQLWAQQEGKVLVTADLDVQMERYGIARELGYFSAGQTDMVMLCMRFALVDALFAEEKPFVILDDPFVNLDDARIAEALRLLERLAADRQIIYLTCSSSRALK